MWEYQYKHGDRPLDGFTIERAAGRGGFGEVYYAVSDSGREVALKAVQGYEQIELRGISQCMNLKNPHLVTIFDVKHNQQGRPFVIMEFVAGPSLRQLLDDAPAGLGEQKAAFFLREIGKGLSFLHEHGIVHRDMKPGNIFFENGYVKIGDYGLSKLIAPTHQGAQTVTVGTVHYMAPEIGIGKYDRSIDIYALGAVLFEMITGMVPYTGDSPSEILLKHLSSEPDLTGVHEPFATVIKKAMAKDPAQRYQTVQDMVEAVFGSEYVQQSVSVFSPNELSMVAAKVAAVRAGGAAGTGGESSSTIPGGHAQPRPADRFARFGDRFNERMDQFGDRIAARFGTPAPGTSLAADSLDRQHRWLLAALVSIVAGVIAAAYQTNYSSLPDALAFLMVALTIFGGAVGINRAVNRHHRRLTNDVAARKLVTGAMAIAFAAIFSFLFWGIWLVRTPRIGPLTLLAVIVPLFCMDISAWAAPDRPRRWNIWQSTFRAGLFAWIISLILHGDAAVAATIMIGMSLATQMLAPWNPRGATPPEDSAAPAGPSQAGFSPVPPYSAPVYPLLHPAVPVLWLVFMAVSFSCGLTLLIFGGMQVGETPGLIPLGIGALLTAGICLVQAMRRRYTGLWSYLGKPLLLIGCLGALVLSIAVLAGEANHRGHIPVGIFMTVLSGIGCIVALCIPARRSRFAVASASRSTPWPPPPPRIDTPGNENRGDWRQHQRERKLQRWQWRPRLGARRATPLTREDAARIALFPVALVSAVLLIVAVLMSLAVAVHLPDALADGFPNKNVAWQLNTHAFADYPDWPALMSRTGTVLATLLMLLAIAGMMLSRRLGGGWHLLRAVIGAPLFVGAAAVAGSAFHLSAWTTIADLIAAHKPTAAWAAFFGGFERGPLVLAAVMFLLSQIILCWPGRRRAPIPSPSAVSPTAPNAPASPSEPPPPAANGGAV